MKGIKRNHPTGMSGMVMTSKSKARKIGLAMTAGPKNDRASSTGRRARADELLHVGRDCPRERGMVGSQQRVQKFVRQMVSRRSRWPPYEHPTSRPTIAGRRARQGRSRGRSTVQCVLNPHLRRKILAPDGRHGLSESRADRAGIRGSFPPPPPAEAAGQYYVVARNYIGAEERERRATSPAAAPRGGVENQSAGAAAT